MQTDELQNNYFLATGEELSSEYSKELLSNNSPLYTWVVRKICKMAEPSIFTRLEGTYTNGDGHAR